MKTLLLLVLFTLAIRAQPEPPPPNATVCIRGTSKCDGSEYNCVCQHGGICAGPSFTECNCQTPNVWNGTYCEQPLCVGANFPNGGCVHGICDTPGHCKCDVGWRGFDCSINLPCNSSVSCAAGGPCACLHGGTCTDTNVCSCTPGYASDYCEVAVCEGGCGQGTCVSPGVCSCNPGYNGTRCEKPICDPPCIHGPCSSPYTCDCQGTGFSHCPGAPLVCGCDEDECQRGETPCDRRTTCTNFIGNFTCSACPTGYSGTPYLQYPLSPQNKTYFTGGCINSTLYTDTMTSASSSAGSTTQASTSTSAPATSTSFTFPPITIFIPTSNPASSTSAGSSSNSGSSSASSSGSSTTAASSSNTMNMTSSSSMGSTSSSATRTSSSSEIEEDASSAVCFTIAFLLIALLF
eukprot:TRINITY_DN548_c0_g1_i1.p1 TRINITY_DN548_c0_g1~~TRINITY_DN548_c0_g1_i1.p1  ORF type:complete len:406 (-),score=41.73 TRINITY_DN548_c0_g1_i1:125-1342(-)